MPIPFSPPVISNTAQLGANQFAVRTAALGNGGYVVAWNTNFGGIMNVAFQRYDALGNPVGAPVQVANPLPTNLILNDIAVAGDGTFSILTKGSIGIAIPIFERLFVDSFFENTGGPSGPRAVLDLLSVASNGVVNGQFVPGATASTLVVLASVNDPIGPVDLIRAEVSTAGVVTVLPALAADTFDGPGTSLVEMVDGVAGQHIAITSVGWVMGSTGGINTVSTGARDIIALEPGVVVVARQLSDSPQLGLYMLTGTTPNIAAYSSPGVVTATFLDGSTSAGAQSFDIELVDLGAGRILMVWVADGGETVSGGSPVQDGVFAQVYNMNSGAPEGTATQIRSFGTGPNDGFLSAIVVSADAMEDGRVAVGLSYANGLSGFDVFSTILDPRNAGVQLTATTGADIFIGTSFDDTFSGVLNGDAVNGGGGVDTVVFTEFAAHFVDLGAPQSFPATTLILTGIENVTGGSSVDDLRGNDEGNILLGGSGNDVLQGRAGGNRWAAARPMICCAAMRRPIF